MGFETLHGEEVDTFIHLLQLDRDQTWVDNENQENLFGKWSHRKLASVMSEMNEKNEPVTAWKSCNWPP